MAKIRDTGIILRAILNRMLEKYNIDYKYVINNPEIEGLPWYQYYTMTSLEYQEWKSWVMNYLRGTTIPKARWESEFAWINLMWGLKIKEDDNTTTE